MRYTSVLLCLVGLAACRAAAQSKTWDGDAGNLDWFADANWNPDGVPEAGDSVVVDAGGAVIAQSQPIEASTVEINSGLLMDSSSLTLTGQSQITGLTVQGCCTTVLDCTGTLTIDGTSAFLKAVRLNGLGSTILDGTIFCDDMLQTRGVQQTIISGTLTTDARIEMWESSTVIVFGTVDMLNGAAFASVSGGRATNRGTVQIRSAGVASVLGEMETIGGTVRADTGEFRLSGKNSFRDGVIEAVNGGEVVFDSNQVTTVRDTTLRGTGDITLRSGSATYEGTVTGNVQFPGTLEISGRCKLGGGLRNTGDMTWFAATLESAGFGGDIETTGYVTVLGSSVLEVPTAVQATGTLEPRAGLTVYDTVEIDSGGLLLFDVPGGAVRKPSDADPGRVVVSGGVTMGPNFQEFERSTVEIPLDLQGGTVRSRSGVLRFEGGGNWTGGVLDAAASEAEVFVGGFAAPYTVTGSVTAQGSGTVRFGDSLGRPILDVGGTLTLQVTNPNEFRPGVVLDATLNGTGQVVNAGKAETSTGMKLGGTLINNSVLTVDGGEVSGTLRNTSTVLQKVGTINSTGGTFENSGTWTAEGRNCYVFSVSGGTFKNTGMVLAKPGLDNRQGSFDITVQTDNTGLMVADNAVIYLNDVKQVTAGVLSGGQWVAINGGAINIGVVDVVRVESAEVRGDGSGVPWAEGLGELGPGGKLTADSPFDLREPLFIDGGELEVQGGEVTVPSIDADGASSVKIGDGAKLTSDGDVKLHSVLGDIGGVIAQALLPAPAVLETPLLDLGGRLLPGGEIRAGQFDVIGNVACAPGSVLEFDLGGTDNTDVVTVTGSVSLGGSTLRVNLIDEHQPDQGESYVLLAAAGGVTEEFAALELPPLGAGLAWSVTFSATEVTLSVVNDCVPDWNGDGSVNTQDFLAYLNDWNVQRLMDCSGGGCSADLNGDSTVNTRDFLAFLNLWTAGC